MSLIWSVEDDKDLQDLLRFSLGGFGYDIELFDCAEDLFAKLGKGTAPDLILMDVMLPGMDGMAALKQLKNNTGTKKIPVIMLTAKATEANIVGGLNYGADDYMTKPFSVMELSARINANLRKNAKEEVLEADGIHMDTASHECTMDGKKLSLTIKEFALLAELLRAAGKVKTREQLLGEIWGYGYEGETRTLDMHVRTLRGKLGDHAKKLVTVRGIGFKYEV